jgi:hypothetical protein
VKTNVKTMCSVRRRYRKTFHLDRETAGEDNALALGYWDLGYCEKFPPDPQPNRTRFYTR